MWTFLMVLVYSFCESCKDVKGGIGSIFDICVKLWLQPFLAIMHWGWVIEPLDCFSANNTNYCCSVFTIISLLSSDMGEKQKQKRRYKSSPWCVIAEQLFVSKITTYNYVIICGPIWRCLWCILILSHETRDCLLS